MGVQEIYTLLHMRPYQGYIKGNLQGYIPRGGSMTRLIEAGGGLGVWVLLVLHARVG